MKPLAGRPQEPTRRSSFVAIALCVLLLALLTPQAQAQERDRAPGDPSVSQRIQALPATYRKWVQDVAGLMTYPELEYFLELRQDYRRDAFMETFWEPRSAELRARWSEYLRAVGEIAWRDPRVLAFILNGPPGGYSLPDGRVVGRCFSRSSELEIWFYGSSPIAGQSFILIFQQPGVSTGYELSRPGDARAISRRGGLPTTNVRDLCADELHRYANYEITRISGYEKLLDQVMKPPVPSPEWLATFTASTTEVPEDAKTFAVDVEIAFPVRNQSRTGVQVMVEIGLGEAPGRIFDGALAYNFQVQGEIIRNGTLFESFSYRFEGPAPEGSTAVPIGFTRFLRPGTASLSLLVEDIYGDAFARVERQLDVPSPEGRPSAQTPSLSSLTGTLDHADHTLRLLTPPGSVLLGLVRFSARHGGEFEKVAFFLDEKQLISKRRPPYSVEIDLGDAAEPHRVRVVGFAAGEEVATDQIWLNQGAERFRVRLVEPRQGGIYPGSLTARIAVSTPDGSDPNRVEFWVNDELSKELLQPPFSSSLVLPGNELAVVRAVAYLADGSAAEDAVVINATGFVEQVDVQLVEVQAIVSDREGRPVPGLGQEQFALYEDGNRQTLLRFEETSETSFRAALLLDRSVSMEPHLDIVTAAALDFSRGALRSQSDRLAVLSFADATVVDQEFTSNPTEVERALAGLDANGTTALYDAVVQALNYFDGVGGLGSLVLFSDGRDEASQLTLDLTVETAQRAGVVVYTIGFGDALVDRDTREILAELAAETGGRSFFPNGSEQITDIYERILADLRSGYRLTYQSNSNKPESEYREIRVEAEERGLEVRARRGYQP